MQNYEQSRRKFFNFSASCMVLAIACFVMALL